jgi:hypothetical protein
VKDPLGKVDPACVPATLPPGHLARWLRATFLAFVRTMGAQARALKELRAPVAFAPVAEALLSEYT